MKVVFVSNYLNHHQIPFCNALSKQKDIDLTFIQMEMMERERVSMGWAIDIKDYDYARGYYDDPVDCQKLIDNSDIVIWGGVEDENYIKPRLDSGKITLRYSERIYKEGQWKFITPRGLIKKYNDHVKYRKSKVYLMCAGGYVASDFNLIHAYPGKMYNWGYFPKIDSYDIDNLIASKGYSEKDEDKKLELMWSGRMINWKHPDYAVEAARLLMAHNIDFHMTIIGEGPLRERLEATAEAYGVTDKITFMGFRTPEKVREYMQQADIYMLTSDQKEGWGAVLNEAMNCGCAVVCGSGSGSVVSMALHEKNAMVYRDRDIGEFLKYIGELAEDKEKRVKLGKEAYKTVKEVWNPEVAAERFRDFANELLLGRIKEYEKGPLSRAEIISPIRGYRYTRRWKNL